MRLKNLAMALLLGSTALLAGCQVTPIDKANQIRLSIDADTNKIRQAAANAQTHVQDADKHVVAATTQPGNPPATVTHLQAAHAAALDAIDSLSPVGPAVTRIEGNAVTASDLTTTVQTKLDKVNASFWSPRQKTLFIGLGILFAIGAVIAVLVETNGGGPIIAAIGSVLSTVVVKVGKVIWHVGTLGGAWLGKEFGRVVNIKYDLAQAKAAVAEVKSKL